MPPISRTLAFLLSVVPAGLAGQTTADPIAVTGVTVIDVARGMRLTEQTVVVRGARIITLGPTRRVQVPTNSRRINGRGKYLIPGLWDMHVHTFRNRMDAPGQNTDDSEVFFPAFVANGVTGVRDMSTDLADNAQIRRWAVARAEQRLIAPRIVGASPLLDGKPTIQPNALPVTTVSEARHVVDSLIDGGVGYIKVYSGLSRDVYFAIAEQAKRRGVTFAGHVPGSVPAGEASDAGQRSVEHLTGVIADCSPELRAIDQGHLRRIRDSTISRDSANALRREYRRVVSERLQCASLAARFARNQTWQVPTFTVKRPRAFAHDPATRADPRLRFISPQLMAEWKATGLRTMDSMSPADVELQRTMFRIEQRIVGQLHAGGVPFLAGSDVHNPYVYPGFSLHDELGLLVESGLSSLDALRAATINPARFLGSMDSLGTVATGKIADLVMLDADPLADIANTRRIRAVFLNGRFLDRDALDALMAAAERAAAPQAPHPASPTGELRAGELRLTFLGNAGWEITDGRTVVLVDPLLSLDAIAADTARLNSSDGNALVVPDTQAIDARVNRADYILVTHGHLDHALDAPYIARKRGAVVIGTETVANIGRAYGVQDSSLITVRGGEDYDFGTFSLRVIPNIHTALRNKRFYNGPTAGTTPRGLKAPLRVRDFQEGGNLAYLLRLGGHQVLIMGSMNYIEREMEGLRPDVALVGANRGRRQIYDYTARLMRALGHPALVLPTHCCSTPTDAEALAFQHEVNAASPKSRVVIPRRYEPVIVRPLR